MNSPQNWYIVKHAAGHCEIIRGNDQKNEPSIQERWGPFSSQSDAIAHRIGLIRSGKCQPI